MKPLATLHYLFIIKLITLFSFAVNADVDNGLEALEKQNSDLAFKEFRKASKAGDVKGTHYLGVSYIRGWGVPADVNHGVSLIREAAEDGFAEAEYTMGILYSFGTGVDVNQKTAVAWYQRAANQQHLLAQKKMADAYRDGSGVTADSNEAIRYFKLASKSDPSAFVDIGAMYYSGKGVTKNLSKALEMFRAGAEQKHPHAVYWLSYLYSSGEGVEANNQLHLQYLEEAANLGSGRAQYEMGKKYAPMFGDGDPIKAVYWFEKATLSRYPDAKEQLSYALEDSKWNAPTERGKLFWVKALADNGIAQQQWNYSLMLKEGKEVKKDIPLSQKYLFAAAKGEYKEAQFSVGQAYFEGSLGLSIDHKQGSQLIRGAALQRHPEAMKAMAIIYESGTGVEKDPFVAYVWLLFAEKEGAKDLEGLRSHLLTNKLDGGLIATARKRLKECYNLEHCTRPYRSY